MRAPMDERFYPATDECDWELLRYAGTTDTEVIGGWMFMCADTDGNRFYKHSNTRERLVLSRGTAAPRRVETYVEPSKRWGWIAVAHEPVESSKWFLPPIHRVWRPTQRTAIAAIPKVRKRLDRDVARRESGVAAAKDRESRREIVDVNDRTTGEKRHDADRR